MSTSYKSSKEVFAISLERVFKGLNQYIKFPSGRFYFETFMNWNKSQPKEGRKPFFAFLHIQDIHELTHFSFDTYGYKNEKKKEITRYKEAMKKIKNGKKTYKGNTMYDASIAYLDILLESLYSHLEEMNQIDNTVIVFTADHGPPSSSFPCKGQYFSPR